ncbi:hypothetical protein EON77_13570 [bacterium]|nr:MAG: hypothetical protein EON77_13570 [bacterium]
MSGTVGRLMGRVAAVGARILPRLFAFQFLVVARPRPGIRQLLKQSETHLAGPITAQRDADEGAVVGASSGGSASS